MEKYKGKMSVCVHFFLSDFTHSMGVMDLGSVGKHFTWENRQEGKTFIMERLDSFLANRDCLNYFSEATVEDLVTEVSDHSPILLNTDKGRYVGVNRPFRFFEAWTSYTSSLKVVKATWKHSIRGRMEAHKVQRRLNGTARALREWNCSVFWNVP